MDTTGEGNIMTETVTVTLADRVRAALLAAGFNGGPGWGILGLRFRITEDDGCVSVAVEYEGIDDDDARIEGERRVMLGRYAAELRKAGMTIDRDEACCVYVHDGGPDCTYDRTSGPVHAWFGLTYANFLVIHRTHLQSMPVEWQKQFTELLEDLGAAYDLGEVSFEVKTVRDSYVDELTDDEMQLLGITREYCEEETTYTDATGRELRAGWDRVGVPVPDPVPHYRHLHPPQCHPGHR